MEDKEILKLASDTANEITIELDNFITFVRKCQSERDLSNDEISSFIIQLPIMIYSITNDCEVLGLKEDNAKSLKTKVYATAYNELTGTVESKKNCALLQIQEEQMLESVCKTSYKIVQGKINMAYELLNSLKKVLNIRIAELELSRVNRGEV